MYFEESDQFTKFKQEHEAQSFAAELLMPHSLFQKVKHLSVKEIANYFCVNEDLVKFFFKKGEVCQ